MLSDHYHRNERLGVTIITVDPATLRIEAVGKDAAVIQISVGNRPPTFRWPVEGERWIVERESYEWTLVEKIEDPDTPSITEGQPGDLMGPDGWIPQHRVPATNGQALVWTSQGWVPENVATQVEFDNAVTDLENEIDDLRPQLVSALPAGVDGKEIYYQDAAMAAIGVVWHLRYRVASASAYKWEYIGGSPMNMDAGTGVQTITAINPTFQDLNGPITITPPLSGDYQFWFGMSADNAADGQQVIVGWQPGAGATVTMTNHRIANWTDQGRNYRWDGLTAGTVLKARGSTTQSGARILQVRATWHPIRVG